jgi:hypothetical protein
MAVYKGHVTGERHVIGSLKQKTPFPAAAAAVFRRIETRTTMIVRS